MKLRPAVAIALAVCLAASGGLGASAATKPKPKPKPPPCKTLTDPVGDMPQTKPDGATGKLYNPNLDIVSADVANNATVVTGVIRLARLDVTDDKAPTGRRYKIEWIYGSTGVQGFVDLALTPSGMATSPVDATVKLDHAKAEIRITAKIDKLVGHPTFAKGDTMLLKVTSDIERPNTPGLSPVGGSMLTNGGLGDTGEARKPYVMYSPSCVKPGA